MNAYNKVKPVFIVLLTILLISLLSLLSSIKLQTSFSTEKSIMEIDRNLSHFCKNSEEYQTWEYLSTLPSTSIYSADTSPDGRWLALGKYNTVEVWNISTMTLYYSFALAADANLHISFSPDGKYLGISSGKVIRYIINTTTWQNIDIGNWDTSASITCFDWSRDSEYLFINSYLTYLYKYYMNGTYQCHFYNSNQINSIDCSPDGNFVATGSYIYLRIHRTNDLEKINEKETAQIINAISYSPDGSRIAAGCNGGYVYCWNTSNFAEPVNRNLGGSPITAISWLPGLQPVIIAGCSNGTLLFLEPVTLNIVKVLKYAGTTTQINTIAYCPYNSKLYTGVYNAAGIVWGKKFNTTLVSPEAGQLLGVDSPLIFRFSEPMNQSTFNMSLFIHPAVNFTWNYNENERMLSIYPQPRFEFNTTYNITFTSALKTLDGISYGSDLRFSVTTDKNPPSVISTQPEDGRQNVSTSSWIEIMFNMPMNYHSVVSAFNINPPLAGKFALNRTSDTWSLLFIPENVSSGTTYTVSIAGTACSASGSYMETPYTFSFTTRSDGVPPYVSKVILTNNGSELRDGGSGIPINSVFEIIFSEEVNYSSLMSAVSISPVTAFNISFKDNYKDRALISFPSFLRSATQYSLIISTTLRDLAGNNMAYPYSLNFSTTSSAVIPEVQIVSPANNSSGVSLWSPVIISFSKEMDITSVGKALHISPEGDYSVEVNMSSVIIRPVSPFKASTLYTITINSSAKALNGNFLAKDYIFIFITSPDNTPPSVIGISPSEAASSPIYSLNIHFSEPVNISSLRNALSVFPAYNFTITAYGNISTIVFNEPIRVSKTDKMEIVISPGVSDLAGNTMNSSFRTEITILPSGGVEDGNEFMIKSIKVWSPCNSSWYSIYHHWNYTASSPDTGSQIAVSAFVPPQTSLELTFTISLNPRSFLESLSVSAGVEYSISFKDENTTVVMEFLYPLSQGQTSSIVIQERLKSFDGKETGKRYILNITAFKAPDVNITGQRKNSDGTIQLYGMVQWFEQGIPSQLWQQSGVGASRIEAGILNFTRGFSRSLPVLTAGSFWQVDIPEDIPDGEYVFYINATGICSLSTNKILPLTLNTTTARIPEVIVKMLFVNASGESNPGSGSEDRNGTYTLTIAGSATCKKGTPDRVEIRLLADGKTYNATGTEDWSVVIPDLRWIELSKGIEIRGYQGEVRGNSLYIPVVNAGSGTDKDSPQQAGGVTQIGQRVLIIAGIIVLLLLLISLILLGYSAYLLKKVKPLQERLKNNIPLSDTTPPPTVASIKKNSPPTNSIDPADLYKEDYRSSSRLRSSAVSSSCSSTYYPEMSPPPSGDGMQETSAHYMGGSPSTSTSIPTQDPYSLTSPSSSPTSSVSNTAQAPNVPTISPATPFQVKSKKPEIPSAQPISSEQDEDSIPTAITLPPGKIPYNPSQTDFNELKEKQDNLEKRLAESNSTIPPDIYEEIKNNLKLSRTYYSSKNYHKSKKFLEKAESHLNSAIK